MFGVIMPFYISLPSSPKINTLCTAIGYERFSVFRLGRRALKSGHLWHQLSFRPAVSAGLLQAPRVEQHIAVFSVCVFRDRLITSESCCKLFDFSNLSERSIFRYSY